MVHYWYAKFALVKVDHKVFDLRALANIILLVMILLFLAVHNDMDYQVHGYGVVCTWLHVIVIVHMF